MTTRDPCLRAQGTQRVPLALLSFRPHPMAMLSTVVNQGFGQQTISPSCLGTHQERTAVNELQNCKQKTFASKEAEQEPKADPKRKLGQSSSHGTIFQSFRHAKTFPAEAEKQVAPASIRTVQYYSWENKWLELGSSIPVPYCATLGEFRALITPS